VLQRREKFASSQGGGLKPACSQDWLPYQKAKAECGLPGRRVGFFSVTLGAAFAQIGGDYLNDSDERACRLFCANQRSRTMGFLPAVLPIFRYRAKWDRGRENIRTLRLNGRSVQCKPAGQVGKTL
jgi:hypothetical protein